MEVGLLGPLDVRDDRGQPVALTGFRQRTLLALLALRPRVVTAAERLIEDLWAEKDLRQPANALQVVVFKVRRTLGTDRIVTRPPGYLLDVADDDVDAHRFERLVGEGRAALGDGRAAAAADCFDRALGLWRGAALAEFADVPTAVAAASRWEELRESVSEDRFDALLGIGRHTELVPELDAAITAAPFRERLRGQLMIALYRSGRQADALRAYADARRVLADELGLEPSTDLRRLETAILDHDPSLEAPPTVSSAAPTASADVVRQPAPAPAPTNLRRSLTTFVGRADDMTGVAAALAEHRLVTLVGTGGCGKTRLATEFAAGRLDEYPGGAWFVAFDTVGSDEVVLPALADALGLSSADVSAPLASPPIGDDDRVRGFLADRTALVILDNCEHVIDGAARLAGDLLESAPRLRLLATSREALRVPGETVWVVAPLDTDDAVTLFADRARAATSAFDPTEAERSALADLCTRLDGMPLAIELTAARSNAFTVTQLSERIDDRFRLLTGGARTALPRQQTLRAVTDWSYDLLFDQERRVFERLSVFAGSCTLEAAEWVCADDQLSHADVGSIVGRLVDKSLLMTDGSGRFRLLQTLAQYGRERLIARDYDELVRDRHAEYYRDLAERSWVDWRQAGGHPQTWWIAHLTAELDNLRAALTWSIGRADASTARLLAGSLAFYWWNTGRTAEGHGWLGQALDCPGDAPESSDGLALAWNAFLGIKAGRVDTALDRIAEALDVADATGDPPVIGLARTAAAELAALHGHLDVAAAHLDHGQLALEAAQEPWTSAFAAQMRCYAQGLAGRHEEAEREIVTAIELFRSVGDVCSVVTSLDQLIREQQSMARYESVEASVREARDVSAAHGLRGWNALMSSRLASLIRQGDPNGAVELYRSALDVARELALPDVEAIALDGLGLVWRRTGDIDEARRCHEASRRVSSRFRTTRGAARSAIQLGYVAEEAGDTESARRLHLEALSIARDRSDARGIASAMEGLASAAAASDDSDTAAMLLWHAAQLRADGATPLWDDDRLDVERTERAVRARLGDRYESAFEAGRDHDLDDVVARLGASSPTR